MPPDQPRVLRCTSAIADKRKKFAEYLAKGIVSASDCTVIAVNICRLSDIDFDGNGISRLPLLLEAVFPVGPLGVSITPEGNLADSAQHTSRYSLQKSSGREIQTANFLDPVFEHVSAVIQRHQADMFQRELSLSTIHNPLARNPLPTGLLGANREFVAKERGSEYLLTNIAATVS